MEDMEQFAEMMKAMQGGQGQNKKSVDKRQSYRFVDPKIFRENGAQFSLDGPYTIQYGQDPLDEEMKKNSWKKLDMFAWQAKHFLRHRHDPNFNPLHSILSQPHWSVEEKRMALQTTLMYGPNVNKGVGHPPETPLRRALRQKQGDGLVATLLDAGADPNAMDQKGTTPLFDAIQYNNPELIPVLLRKGAKLQPRADGTTLQEVATQQFLATGDLKTWFSSMAHIKKFKLYDKDDFLNDKDKNLLRKHVESKSPHEKEFLEELFQSFDQIKSDGKVIQTGAIRPFTNPSMHTETTHQGRYIKHPWFDTFPFSIINQIQRSGDDDTRLHKLKMGNVVIDKLLNDPSYLTEDRKEWIFKNRSDIAFDLVIPKDPNGDCLLTKAAREGNLELVKFAAELNVNLNARDKNGKSALHLLTENLEKIPAGDIVKKKQYFEMVTQLVGMPGDGKGRKSLYDHGSYGDWFISDPEGKTFLDQLENTKPEWANELREHLGLPKENILLDVVLENPVNSLLSYDSSLNRSPDKIPVVAELSPIAPPRERQEKEEKLGSVLIDAYDYISDVKDEHVKQQIKERIEQNFKNAEPDVKLGMMLGLAASWKDDDVESPVYKALEGTLANIAHDMQNPKKKEQMFDAFDNLLSKMDEQGADLKSVKNIATQAGVLSSNPDLIEMGQRIERHLSQLAEQRYGSVENDQDINQGQKPNR